MPLVILASITSEIDCRDLINRVCRDTFCAGRLDALAQPEKCQDREDDHDEANEVDNTVHVCTFRVGSRITSRTPRNALKTKVYSPRALARRRSRGFMRVIS
jgi:hypothetical protein